MCQCTKQRLRVPTLLGVLGGCAGALSRWELPRFAGGDLNVDVGNDSDSGTRKGVIGRNSPSPHIRIRVFFSCWGSVAVTDCPYRTPCSKIRGVHLWTWHKDTLGRRSIIDFVVVSSDLRHSGEERGGAITGLDVEGLSWLTFHRNDNFFFFFQGYI